MSRIPIIAKALLVGLVITQAVASLHVYSSNHALLRKAQALASEGYFVVPNDVVASTLSQISPAIFGGLFFTLSLGAGLSIVAAGLAWFWVRLCGRARLALLVAVGIWVFMLAGSTHRGFAPFVFVHFFVTPPLVFIFTAKWLFEQSPISPSYKRAFYAPVVSLLALIVVWAFLQDNKLFVNIRDFLLLPTSMGQKVNAFYYRYTLYPAEVFKPMEQKTIRTSRLNLMAGNPNARRLATILVQYDYLPVSNDIAAALENDLEIDLEVVEAENRLLFRHKARTILELSADQFFSDPQKSLADYSSKTDCYGFFRIATFAGILIGFPLALYVAVYSLFFVAASFYASPAATKLIAGGLCFLIGVAAALPVSVAHKKMESDEQIMKGLMSAQWQQRVLGLRAVVDRKLDIANFLDLKLDLRRMAASPWVPERYWLANALGTSRYSRSSQILKVLLDDPDLNVECMALLALGKRHDKQAISDIVPRVKASKSWYVQWYGYRALKELGWRQALSGVIGRV